MNLSVVEIQEIAEMASAHVVAEFEDQLWTTKIRPEMVKFGFSDEHIDMLKTVAMCSYQCGSHLGAGEAMVILLKRIADDINAQREDSLSWRVRDAIESGKDLSKAIEFAHQAGKNGVSLAATYVEFTSRMLQDKMRERGKS